MNQLERVASAGKRVSAKARLRARDAYQRSRSRATRVAHRAAPENVYHCCVHKTGSQWIRRILRDRRIYKYSGMRTHHYQSELPGGHDPRRIPDRAFGDPFPKGTIVTPLYLDYANFAAMPKPEAHAAFFVMRDPRDITVSWYFSSRYSHRLMGDLVNVRRQLSTLPESAGLAYAIRYLEEFGLFAALRSWKDAEAADPSVVVTRFEDLIGPSQLQAFASVLGHCDIRIPETVLQRVLADYSFERLSGRRRGEEDERAFYRKGIAGDWREHFDHELAAEFESVTGGLARHLGYGD